MTKEERRLPLGAIRTTVGDVVVPASRRADGSTRKPIRIRQGYVPQDEVPKYKSVAQRQREKKAERASEANDSGDADVEELSMDKLSLQQKIQAPASKERPCSRDKTLHEENGEQKPQLVKSKIAATRADDTSAGNQQQQLKRQLTKFNKQLKEIAKLEDVESALLSKQQKQKIAWKTQLQQQRNDVIAELNGATVTRRSSPATGPRPKVAISL